MKTKSTTLVIAALMGILSATPRSVESTQSEKDSAPNWQEQNAYTLGVQAYLYAFPWWYFPEARWLRTDPRAYLPEAQWPPADAIKHEPNHFLHVRKLEDAGHLSGGAPNNDTLYSRAWVYLQDEPVIISVPAIKNRYYTMEIVDFMGDNFAYVGVRATGTEAGDYAIIGPNWKGTLPDGVKALPPAATPWATILGRTLVKEGEDLKVVFAIQDQYKLTPLSQWKKPDAKPPVVPEIWKPLDPKADPLAEWKTINRAIVEVPPATRDADLLQAYARIGIGPGLDVEKQDEAIKRGLARAAVDGKKIIAGAFTGGYLQKQVNGWSYPPLATGRPTPSRDWLFRAVQALAGFVANDPVEAIYLNVSLDGEGKPLSGESRYEVRFPKGGLPKVKAFWSVTMYNPQYNLVANPINRYSLGDRSGMKANEDGSITMYVQKDTPGPDKQANWLPAPEGNFFLIMRTYLPAEDLVNQTWRPPPLTRVDKK